MYTHGQNLVHVHFLSVRSHLNYRSICAIDRVQSNAPIYTWCCNGTIIIDYVNKIGVTHLYYEMWTNCYHNVPLTMTCQHIYVFLAMPTDSILKVRNCLHSK